MSSLEECLFVFCPVFNWIVCFLHWAVCKFWEIKHLCVKWFTNIFSRYFDWHFILCMVSYTVETFWVKLVPICLFLFMLNYSCCCCSVTQSCETLVKPMVCRTPGISVLYHLLELAQTHIHWVSDATQSSHSIVPFFCLQSFPASESFLMNQSTHQVAKVLKFHLQHQSFQWIFRTDFH